MFLVGAVSTTVLGAAGFTPSNEPNMNGQYAMTAGTPQDPDAKGFPTDFKDYPVCGYV
jgi:hypothetical protein